MKFLVSTLLNNNPDPFTGLRASPRDLFLDAIAAAVQVEELGLDAFGVGERHAQDFVSSAPPVILGAIAARTTRIRLMTTVTVLPLLDPVRVAEDYATVDQLSGGRLELIIGKGNDPRQLEIFGIDPTEQWNLNRDKYGLLRRLLDEFDVDWEGSFRPPLSSVTTTPRPFQPRLPIWHGSATSTESTELAAEYGDPLFSANAFHEMEKYGRLIDHYREQIAAHGFSPDRAVVGAGSGPFFIARTSQEAVAKIRPFYNAMMSSFAAQHNQSKFSSLEEAIAWGPVFVGSRQQVLDQIGRYHERFQHDVFNVSVHGLGLAEADRDFALETFASEVAPELRRLYPTPVWEPARTVLEQIASSSPGSTEGPTTPWSGPPERADAA
jgi:alkanesulfonate monooxygenase SsuD/methylene tetrahydromethanopterin reductase-like flavin-dependent oxidoreductase (luciferase family)